MLIRAYGGEIVGTCVGRMSDPVTGEDAAQDTLARALIALPDYRGNAGLRPWLHRIAANRCIDLMRSGGIRRSRTIDDYQLEQLRAPLAAMPFERREEATVRARRVALVRGALASVKEPDRTWVELHYTHGVAYDEIAEESGISRAAVKQRIWRAVKKVRAKLVAADDVGGDDERD